MRPDKPHNDRGTAYRQAQTKPKGLIPKGGNNEDGVSRIFDNGSNRTWAVPVGHRRNGEAVKRVGR